MFRSALLAVFLAIGGSDALAQRFPRQDRDHGQWQQRERMNPEERQRLREDVNSVRGDYRNERMHREAGGNRLSPEERERLRRDVYDANRDLRRK